MSGSNDLVVTDVDSQKSSVAATPAAQATTTVPRKSQQSFGRTGRRTRSATSAQLQAEGLTPVATPTKDSAEKAAPEEREASDASPLLHPRPAVRTQLPPTPENSPAGRPGPSSPRRSRDDGNIVFIPDGSDDETLTEAPPRTPGTAPEVKRPRRKYAALDGPSQRPRVPQETTLLLTPETAPASPNTPTPTRPSGLHPGGGRPIWPRVVSEPAPRTATAGPHAARPASTPRSRTEPTPRSIKDGERSIDAKIDSYLREPTPDPKPGKELGYVYIVPVLHGGQKILKIGSTAEKDPQKRIQKILAECRVLDFEAPGEDGDEPRPRPEFSPYQQHYKRAEKLAHIELDTFLYKFQCICPRDHKEFFDVDLDTARRTVDRWLRLCAQDPWYPSPDKGQERPKKSFKARLKPHWDDRLARRAKQHAAAPADKHGGSRERWDEFVNMRFLDVAQFVIAAVWKACMSSPWRTLSVLESLAIFVLAPAGLCWWAFAWLCSILAGALSGAGICELAVVVGEMVTRMTSDRRPAQPRGESSNPEQGATEDAVPAGTWPEGSQDGEAEEPSPRSAQPDGDHDAGSSHEQDQVGDDGDERRDEWHVDSELLGA